MKKSIIVLATLFFGLVLFSCNDETPPTNEELLTGITWIIKTKVINPPFSQGGITVSDISVLETEDVKNNSYKFNTDGTLVLYNMSNEIILQTNWSFNADETKITLTPGIVNSYPIVGDISLNFFYIDVITANQIVSTNPYLYDETNYVITVTFLPK